jgi:heme exporter protein D
VALILVVSVQNKPAIMADVPMHQKRQLTVQRLQKPQLIVPVVALNVKI